MWKRGSIPACAGEPQGFAGLDGVVEVHPRVCGGAVADHHRPGDPGGPSPRVRGSRRPVVHFFHLSGPSPRVRGSLIAERGGYDQLRSIPACAGEPPAPCQDRDPQEVHPRVCGGAACTGQRSPASWGPSPRVRGSRDVGTAAEPTLRSIPACAGEPGQIASGPTRNRVHPRVCGGATFYFFTLKRLAGPSPRVRGSRGP